MLQGGSAAKFQVHSCHFCKGKAGRDDLVLALVGRQQDGVSTSPHDPGEAPSPCLALKFLTSKVLLTLT